MTIYDLLTDNVAILRRFHRNGVPTQSVRFLPLYERWRQMLADGYKKQYIEGVLAEQFGYTTRYIRLIIKFMEEKVI